MSQPEYGERIFEPQPFTVCRELADRIQAEMAAKIERDMLRVWNRPLADVYDEYGWP
jgi:hypothetical protein